MSRGKLTGTSSAWYRASLAGTRPSQVVLRAGRQNGRVKDVAGSETMWLWWAARRKDHQMPEAKDVVFAPALEAHLASGAQVSEPQAFKAYCEAHGFDAQRTASYISVSHWGE